MRTTTSLLLAAVGALVALSLTMLASASIIDKNPDLSLRSQIVACVAGCIGLAVFAAHDYRRNGRLTWVVYGVAIVLLILVLSPLGRQIKGAQRWLFGTQPSELGKLALVLALAWYGGRQRGSMTQFVRGLLFPGLIAFPIVLLVVVEPDRGTALLLSVVTLLMLLVAGVRWLFVAPVAIVGALSFGVVLWISPMARERVDAWLHPDLHKDDKGLQQRKALFAFAEGGVEGRGLGRGSLKYTVPEMNTDFILPAVGEELGLPFTLGVVGAYTVILLCGLQIASRSPDRQGLLLASGVTFLIAAQACINLGVVTRLLPNKGMPLPFISRGGTSIAVMLCLVGVLLAVARQAVPAVASSSSSGGGSERDRGRRRGGRNPFGESDTDFVTAE